MENPSVIKPNRAFEEANRPRIAQVEFRADLKDAGFDRHDLMQVSGKDCTFRHVSFKYALIEDCYFRNCRFDDCDFTGAVFRNTSLRGSTFEGCHFDYSRFSNTVVPRSILERNMPGYENVALELARALRVNYAQLGDSEGANAAITAELRATMVHLKKAAFSSESWYRKKYTSAGRVRMVGQYLLFIFLDLVWGHGESVWRLLRTGVLLFALLALIACGHGRSLGEGVADAWTASWGTYTGSVFSGVCLGLVSACRFLLIALFVTVLVRRFSRR